MCVKDRDVQTLNPASGGRQDRTDRLTESERERERQTDRGIREMNVFRISDNQRIISRPMSAFKKYGSPPAPNPPTPPSALCPLFGLGLNPALTPPPASPLVIG